VRVAFSPVRLFFALPLPEDARARLAALRAELEERAPDAPVTWVPTENMHVTLRFLDEVADDVLPAVQEAARETASHQARFPIALEGVGTFGGRASPRVIWVGVKEDAGKAALISIAAELERRVRVVGFAPADHPFSAHMTLGRIRPPRGKPAKKPARMGDLVEAVAVAKFGPLEVRVDRFVLYESRLRGPQHPEYVETASFALS
jgi:2'-5' RNA ligase